MNPQLKVRLITREYADLTQLETKASMIEHFILEKKQRRANQAYREPYLVSIIDNDSLGEVINFLEEQALKVMAVEILKGRLYSCLALRPSKGKEATRFENKVEYLFDISKAN